MSAFKVLLLVSKSFFVLLLRCLTYAWQKSIKERDIKVHWMLNYIANNCEILNESFTAGFLFSSQNKKLGFFGIIPVSPKYSLREFILQKIMPSSYIALESCFLPQAYMSWFSAMFWSKSTFTGSTGTPLTSPFQIHKEDLNQIL